MLEVRVRGVEHHAHEGDCLERRAQSSHVITECPDVERLSQDGTPHDGAARLIRVVVRVLRGHKTNAGLTLEPLHHVWRVLQELLDRLGIECFTRFSVEVAPRHDTGFFTLLWVPAVARNPENPTAECGRATEQIRLFNDQHIQPGLCHDNRRRQAPCA